MSFNRLLFFCCLFLALLMKAKAQPENDALVETIVESVAENAGEDFDVSELTERLNFYRKNPININKATSEQFQELMFLSPLQISQLLSYREQNYVFLELYELQSIESLDLQTIKKLLPFITLQNVNPLAGLSMKSLLNNGRNDLLFTLGQNLQRPAGYVAEDGQTGYEGGPQRFLTRYRFYYANSLSVSLTMEKDAGERFFNRSAGGFDFYSGNISYRGAGLVKKAVVGDYSLQFGQGLTLWTGLSFSKGAAVASVVKNEIGLKGYGSTNEALFLRGTSATLQFKRLEFTPFVSYRKLDASSTQAADTTDSEIRSLQQSGLHRTASEILNENAVGQTFFGLNVQYNTRHLKLGSLASHSLYSKAFQDGQQVYNKFDFAGTQLSNAGIYYNYSWRNLYLFGEGAHSLGAGSAVLNGLMSSLSSKLALVLFYRNYQKNYYSFYNQAVAEGSTAVNEKGLYSGLVYSPGRKYEFSAYVDFFRFPWMRFGVDAPSSGYEILSQFTYTPDKKLRASVRYKVESKQENDDLDNTINFLQPVFKQNFRLEFSYKLNEEFQVRNRAEASIYRKGEAKAEPGFLLFQDLVYNPMVSKISGNVRFALFDVKSYNARIYAYENDVLYGFSAPAYQNQGIRFYANIRYQVKKGIDMWFRYALTEYSNVDEIGSGTDKISGNKKSDFKVQLRFQF